MTCPFLTFAQKVPPTAPSLVEEPCKPSPCGPNSVCRPVGNAPVCSCQSNYLGLPPDCRPECVSSSECAPSQACLNLKCQDPCKETCGRDAQCKVVNHNPICVCPSGWTGDPMTGCRIIPSKHDSTNYSNSSTLCNCMCLTSNNLTFCSTHT